MHQRATFQKQITLAIMLVIGTTIFTPQIFSQDTPVPKKPEKIDKKDIKFKLIVTQYHPDTLYKIGETVVFTIQCVNDHGTLPKEKRQRRSPN